MEGLGSSLGSWSSSQGEGQFCPCPTTGQVSSSGCQQLSRATQSSSSARSSSAKWAAVAWGGVAAWTSSSDLSMLPVFT